MTMTIEINLESVKMDQRVRYLGQRWFSSKVISWHTDRHTAGQLLNMDY